MSSPLICDRCGQEIVPGTQVEFVTVTLDSEEEPRIMLDGDALVAHAECPVQ